MSILFCNRCYAAKLARQLVTTNDRSIVVGFGKNYPKRAQDRGASCPPKPDPCTWANFYADKDNYVTLKGAVIEGFYA